MDVSTWNSWSSSTTPAMWHMLENSSFHEFSKPMLRVELPTRAGSKGSGKQLQKKGGGGGGLVAGRKRRPGMVHEG